MNINEDVDKEYPKLSNEDDIVIPPSSDNIEKSGETITLVAPGPNENYLEPPQEFIESLPEHNIKLQTVTDKINKVHDLKEVESNVMGLESICYNEAVAFESYIPDLFVTKLKRAHFSSSCKSKSGLNSLQKAVEDYVIDQQVDLITNYNTVIVPLVSNTLAVLKCLQQDIQETLGSMVRGIMYSYMTKDNGIVESLKKSVNTLYPFEKDFISVINTDITLVNFSNLNLQVNQENIPLDKYKDIIIKSLSCPLVRNFFFSIIEGKTIDQCLNKEDYTDYSNKSVTGLDLFKFITSESINGYLEDISLRSQDLIKEIETKYSANEEFCDSIIKADLLSGIQDCISKTSEYARIIVNTRILFSSIDNLGVIYKKL